MDKNKLEEKINQYLDFRKSDKYDEQYKFELFKNNKIDFTKIDNFETIFKNVRKQAINLLPRKVRDNLFIHLGKYHLDELKKLFSFLYDETIGISERVDKFIEEVFYLIKNDKNLENKDLWRIWFADVSFFLSLYDYKKYLFVNPIIPFNNFVEEFNLDKKLYKDAKNGERYKNWLNLVNNEIMPIFDEITKDITFLDIQDFIFCEFWGYKGDLDKEFQKWLKYAKNETKYILWILVELQKKWIDDLNWFIKRERLWDELKKVTVWRNQNTSQYFSHDFDPKRKGHSFLQKVVIFLPEWVDPWDIKTHYKVNEEYLDFLSKNIDKLKNWDELLLTNTKNYWIYSPWENTFNWENEKKEWFISIGWEELWNLSKFKTRKELEKNIL